MEAVRIVNLALRFAIELAALAALAYGGYELGGSSALRFVLAVALPAVAAVAWGRYVSPKRAVDVLRLRVAAEVLVLGGAAFALGFAGHPGWGAAFGVVAVLNRVLDLALSPARR